VAPVPNRLPQIRRGPGERAQAWAVTGPLGHLWSTVADVVVLWYRYLLARARARGG
jgi:hypothetical protein